jgi:hypothetical protein
LTQLTNAQQLTLQIINDLHESWQPHAAQLKVGKEFLSKDIDTMFIQCGRKWGKTEFALYLLWRHALLNPGSACYYVTPEFSHGKKIVWHDPRLTQFFKKAGNYISSINGTECMVKLKNGSFMQIIGSENYASANGLRPGFLIYDEFCEFNHRFHETMNPNRMVFKCPLVLIGTPPRADSRNKEQYMQYAEECKNSKNKIHVVQTSFENPLIDKELLLKEKELLFARGEEWLWYSQYEAKITAGGKHVIFPMLSRDLHVVNHDDLYKEIERDTHKLEWYCVVDPGTTTCMAFMFAAVNPYTKRIYIMDEIYETKASETSVRQIMPRAERIAKKLAPSLSFDEDWVKVYDEAAAWFANEVQQQYGYWFMPTLKQHNKKENGVSLIKDCLVHKAVVISDRCQNLLKEMEGYVADENGRFPKVNDHLIDAFRYFLAAAGYSMVQVMEATRFLGPRKPGSDMHDGIQRAIDPWAGEDWTEFAD